MSDKETPRSAIVTGGTRGIGRAIADQLARDGVSCVVTGTTADRPGGLPEHFAYHGADLRESEDLESLCRFITSHRPSILVNNAGINIKGETASFAMADYDALQSVNVRSPFALIQAAIPGMTAHGWGRIVNITSLWGLSGNPRNAAYCGSKFGLDGLTASVAAELAPMQILVNSVAPGYVYTEAAAEAFTPEALADVEREIPLGRLAQPSEIASLVGWLASDSNTYMTGQNLLIDGGLTRTAHP